MLAIIGMQNPMTTAMAIADPVIDKSIGRVTKFDTNEATKMYKIHPSESPSRTPGILKYIA